jgi:hypothetical protein
MKNFGVKYVHKAEIERAVRPQATLGDASVKFGLFVLQPRRNIMKKETACQ